MSKPRRGAKPMPNKHIIPFSNAEEAWFWFMRSTRVRIDGARLTEDATNFARPCEPDDLYRFVMGLRRRRIINDAHLRVLAEYGWREQPPDGRVREQARAQALWAEAMDRLFAVLAERAIVEPPRSDRHDRCGAQENQSDDRRTCQE